MDGEAEGSVLSGSRIWSKAPKTQGKASGMLEQTYILYHALFCKRTPNPRSRWFSEFSLYFFLGTQ